MTARSHEVAVAGDAPYTIHIGADLLGDGALLARSLRGRDVMLVSDRNVAPLYADRVAAALQAARPEAQVHRHVLPAGEAANTLAQFAEVTTALAEAFA